MKRLVKKASSNTCRDCQHTGMPKNKILKWFADPTACYFDWDKYNDEEFEQLLNKQFNDDFEQFIDYCANIDCSMCPNFVKQD